MKHIIDYIEQNNWYDKIDNLADLIVKYTRCNALPRNLCRLLLTQTMSDILVQFYEKVVEDYCTQCEHNKKENMKIVCSYTEYPTLNIETDGESFYITNWRKKQSPAFPTEDIARQAINYYFPNYFKKRETNDK